jgi:hypothetical protein
MPGKIATPKLEPIDDTIPPAGAVTTRPDLRTAARRSKPLVDSLIATGFVADAAPSERTEPDDTLEAITIEVPRRLKRALQGEVAARRDDPDRRSVGSLKSVILEALAAHGFREFIRESDIEVQSGIFMKRQSAQMRRR